MSVGEMYITRSSISFVISQQLPDLRLFLLYFTPSFWEGELFYLNNILPLPPHTLSHNQFTGYAIAIYQLSQLPLYLDSLFLIASNIQHDFLFCSKKNSFNNMVATIWINLPFELHNLNSQEFENENIILTLNSQIPNCQLLFVVVKMTRNIH